MERCPCCNSRLRESSICPRCQADLSEIFNTEHSAEYWLTHAIQHWMKKEIKHSIEALEHSIRLKKTDLALVFRRFLIEQQGKDILFCLAQKQMITAKSQLYTIRPLFPYSKLLQELNNFTDYLLIENMSV